MEFFYMRGQGLLAPRYDVAPYQEWRVATSKATMPSPEGHEDLKRSWAPTYKGNTAWSMKSPKLEGLTLIMIRYSIYPNLGRNLGVLEHLL